MNSELHTAIGMAFQQAEQALAAKEPWRNPFRTTNRLTPMSANTAIHIVA